MDSQTMLLLLICACFCGVSDGRTLFKGNGSVLHASKSRGRVCLTSSCKKAAEEMLSYMNTSVDPCHDFYDYACGSYDDFHTIPPDETETSVFHDLGLRLLDDLQDILDSDENETSPARIAARELYELCMDEELTLTETVEDLDSQPLLELLNRTLGGWPILTPNWDVNSFDLWAVLSQLDHMGSAPLVVAGITADLHNATLNMLSVGVSSGFSKNLLSTELGKKYIRRYPELMKNVTRLLANCSEDFEELKNSTSENSCSGTSGTYLNWTRIEQELKQIVELYSFLTNLSTTSIEARDFEKFYNIMNISTVSEKYFFRSNFSEGFVNFLRNVLLPGNLQDLVKPEMLIVVPKPSSFEALDKRMVEIEAQGSNGKRLLANFVGWRLVASFGRDLSKRFKDAYEVQDRILSGTNHTEPIWKTCIHTVAGSMPLALGSMYVEKVLDDRVQPKVREMVDDIRRSFRHHLQNISWMDETTRERALKKLEHLREYVTHPEFFLTNHSRIDYIYRHVKICDTLFETDIELSRAANIRHIKRLTKRNERDDLFERLYTVTNNAQYLPQSNFIAIFAGLTQSPMFDVSVPEYINYGGLGYVIGHEITHAFDDVGSRFNENGHMVDWWSMESKKAYKQKTADIVCQYNAYKTKFGKVNGNLTLSENIADAGGLKTAFYAYEMHLQRQKRQDQHLPGLSNHTSSMMFFLSSAQVWCGIQRPEQEELNLVRDSHSPGRFRVNGPLSNLPDFAKAYGCKEGDAMVSRHSAGLW